MQDESNPYAKAVRNRREKSRADLETYERELNERERALEEREADVRWKVEVASEAIIAMVKDAKRGKVSPWAKFSQAALALEHTDAFQRRVPKAVIEMMKSERIIDLEERKDTPTVAPDGE